ncbi:hypothetical protein AAKU55_003610 [Oxalobacteraceae bacterium GrIS 1.11]
MAKQDGLAGRACRRRWPAILRLCAGRVQGIDAATQSGVAMARGRAGAHGKK